MTKRGLMNRAVKGGIVLVFMSLPLLSGCTPMASKEQLAMLEEARKAAEASEADLGACRQKKADVERQVTRAKQNLKAKIAERDAVKKYLGQ